MGKTLKIYVMGETPNSLRTVEIVNWTGMAFLGERQHLSAAKEREELAEPGIYLLLSESSEAGLTEIYIGETDDFTKRISDHSQSKDWWDRFIVFVNKDKNFTKAHVRYLERELFLLASRSIANLKVMNTKEPGGASLAESDVSSMKEFLSNIQFVLETLGLSYFSSDPGEHKQEDKNTSEKQSVNGMSFYITLPKELSENGKPPLKAFMEVKNNVYILKAGSFLRKVARESFSEHDHSYFVLWKQIVESNAVEELENTQLVKTVRDIEFRAPSAAGSVVRARSTNGRTEWKRTSDDKSLLDCQNENLKD